MGLRFPATLRCQNDPKRRSSVSGYPPKTNAALLTCRLQDIVFLFHQWDVLVSGSVFLLQELPSPIVLLGFSKGGAVGILRATSEGSLFMADIRPAS